MDHPSSTTPKDESWFNPTSAKISLLILTGVCAHLSLSPPNAPVPLKRCLERRSLFERCVRWVTFCSKMMVWLTVLSDAHGTYASYRELHSSAVIPIAVYGSHQSSFPLPQTNASSLLEHTSDSTTQSHPLFIPSPLLLLGASSVTLGAFLRLWCFRSLGPFFTFELSIHPSHSLITTGPYAFVRHPSYTGIYLTLLGATAVGLAPGSVLREYWLHPLMTKCTSRALAANGISGFCVPLVPATPSQATILILMTFWFVKVWYALRSTHRRLHVEDVELHKVFGETWEAYAEQVPWKLLPGVF